MVSILTHIFGTENLATAEDVVQQTFLDALSVWKLKGIPDNPSAWLFQVAKNKALDIIRKNKHSVQYDFSNGERALLKSAYTASAAMDQFFREESVKDEQLGMMFACCHPGLNAESQVTLILKTLCGFSTAEIAGAFLTGEQTVAKRLYRAKEFFRENKIIPKIPDGADLESRTDSVLHSIYVLFTEGNHPTHSADVLKLDLMEEAMLLCKLLTENENTRFPRVYALLALMCFHAARNPGRFSESGEAILLADQDRSKWNSALIAEGVNYMNLAASGEEISTYHLEAAIAFEHCAAETVEQTRWPRILELYEWLCHLSPSPVASLNRAVAVLQVQGPQMSLEALLELSGDPRMESFYLFHSLLGEIYGRLKDGAKADFHLRKALELSQSAPDRKVLLDKIKALGI